jgi:hypothetical protein
MLFKTLEIATLAAIIPWLAIGWFSVRRESRLWMAIFLCASTVMIASWASMFSCQSFLWTFKTWDFLAVLTCAAGALLTSTLLLGIACRLNFGKGLPNYLGQFELGQGQEPHWEPADDKSFYDHDVEKLADFPSMEQPIPTFSDTFEGPQGLAKLRIMGLQGRPAPGISMHTRGTSAGGSIDFANGLPTRPSPAITLSRSISTDSRSYMESPGGQGVMTYADDTLYRIDTSISGSSESQTSAASRLNRQRWMIE